MKRRYSRPIKVGRLTIGGDAPISVQSMTKTQTRDVETTVRQIKKLEEMGCEIIRVAVPDMESAKALAVIKKQINIPLVADIHFDYRLALEAIAQGVDKLRINPGNIKQKDRIVKIVEKAKEKNIPIRIGVNSGSVDKKRFGKVTPVSLLNSALEHIKILEELDFFDIVISLKATDVPMTIEAYKLMADKVDYPFHLGITESGFGWSGSIKSAVGIGSLLAQGLGDTIRVSLTGDPFEEVKVGYEILKALQLRHIGPELISCPTCARCEIDLIKIVTAVEKEISHLPLTTRHLPLKIAIMGCVVNGPGEASEADIGIAGGKGVGLLFKKGESIKKVPETELIETLLQEIKTMLEVESRSAVSDMKQDLRKTILDKRNLLTTQEITQKSLEIKKRLFNLPEFKNANCISFYISFRNEVKTYEMIKEALKLDKRVFVPVVEEKRVLSLSELKDFNNELEIGKFGILEPKVEYKRKVNLKQVVLVIVPGVVFDEKGNRIGYGGGYYDNLLNKIKDGLFIGLAYEFQIVSQIPATESDVPVHKIITENRIITCN